MDSMFDKVTSALKSIEDAKRQAIATITEIVKERGSIRVMAYNDYDDCHGYEIKDERGIAVCSTDDETEYYPLSMLEVDELYSILKNIDI